MNYTIFHLFVRKIPYKLINGIPYLTPKKQKNEDKPPPRVIKKKYYE